MDKGMQAVRRRFHFQSYAGILVGALFIASGVPEGGTLVKADSSGVEAQAVALEPSTQEVSGATVQSQIDEPIGDHQDASSSLDSFQAESNLGSETVSLVQAKSFGPALRFAGLFATRNGLPEDPNAPIVTHESIFRIPDSHNLKVERHMRFFHTAIRGRFEQWLDRLAHYRPLVEGIFSEFDLPSDLVFLSLVESGFNPNAYSRARATGPWQFMKGTARLYGLRVDQYVDERRDPIKSTVAAARYLRDLYDLFGTWPLAMAAYNAGEGKVSRALQKARAESFWEIAQTRHIRRETKEYVTRFVAATTIAKNPDRYGFSSEARDPHQFEEVVVHRPVHLRDVAKTTGISFLELRRLNPELRRDMTPPTDSEYHLKVPVGAKPTVEQMLDKIPAWGQSSFNPGKGASRGQLPEWYRVRVGDSLAKIAKRFHLSIPELKARNNLTSHRVKPGDLLAIGH